MHRSTMLASAAAIALWPLGAMAQTAQGGVAPPASPASGAAPSAPDQVSRPGAALPGPASAAQPTPSYPAAAPAGSAPSTSGSATLGEIVVTAQRRAQRLQDVPISVNVVTGVQLASRGVAMTQDLPSLVPGLSFAVTGGAGTPYLRGVGDNAGNPNDEPSVATYVDGVYIANPYTNVTSLNNVERIEVLKGPQGTLFGRNATGGVIQVITRDPSSTPEMEVTGGYANYNTASGSLYATTGLAEHLNADIALQGFNQGDGWGKDLATGKDSFRQYEATARSKLVWKPTDSLTFHLSADYAKTQNNFGDYHLPAGALAINGQPPPSNRYDTTTNVTYDNIGEPKVFVQQYGTSLRTDYDTPYGRLVGISAYRKSFGGYDADPDTTPLPIENVLLSIAQQNTSQEVQYISPSSWPVSLTAGAYYYRNTAGYNNVIINGLALGAAPGELGTEQLMGLQHTESSSVYAQADATILPRTTLTVGIRDTHERDTATESVFGAPIPTPEIGYDKPTWRIALNHGFSHDIHAYVSYNRGVKGGGFDLLTPGSTGFKPEQLDAYEAGVKTELLDHRLRFNAAYFYYSYDNIQVQVIPASSAGLVETTNAAKAFIEGLDTDFAFAPLPHLTIAGGFSYIDGKYLQFDNTVAYPESPLTGASTMINASGRETVRTPKYTGNLNVSYEVQSNVGYFPLSATTSYNGGYFFSADNRLKQTPYTLVNLSAGWLTPNRRYGVTFWARNLANTYYLAQGVPSALGDLTEPAAPRTFGFTVQAKFGG